MHLYDEFAAAVTTLEAPYPGRLVDITRRALLGLVKIVVLAPLLRPYSLLHWPNLASVPHRLLLPASCVYSAILFFDFSGYSDLAIACSRLLGITAPENFRAPFLAPDPREFWQRWHMSFTRVLTGYIFVPLSRALSRRVKDDRAIKVVAYTVTFAVCGYWHGSAPRFIWWGLYHAFGLIVFDLFFRRRRNASWLAKSVAVTATFLFVSLGWTLFALPGRS
jgi:D-alanyl-lipoteichoic acid acyltransferase DltB (MBOAT superfamily)